MRKRCTHRLLIGPGLDRALFPSYIGFMTGHEQKRASMWGWGIFASFCVHAVVALIILVGIPFDLPKPEAEETVSVEIVPPPEEAQQAEPAKPEPEITVPEKAEERPAEETAEKPAQQPEPEQQPPPPPPSNPPAEPPQEQAEQAPEPTAEPPSEPPAQAPDTPQAEQASPPLDNFRPVFQFGDKDQGPEQSLQGSAAKEEATTEEAVTDETQSAKDANVAQQEDAGGAPADAGKTPAEAALLAEQPKQGEAAEKPVGSPVPDVLAVPDAGQASATSQADGVPEPGKAGDAAPADNALAESDDSKKPEGASGHSEAEAAGGGAKPSLKKAEKLFSTSATNNPMAMVAMGTMSRGERAAELCNSELGAQLANGTPRYAASRLPKPRLRSGNVIDVETAFSTRSQWYNVSFRCEVDKDAMKVVSFAHDVGSAIPKNEWKSRHLPSPY